MISMEPGEKRLKQEDCNEDELGTGILTLTNQRVAIDLLFPFNSNVDF